MCPRKNTLKPVPFIDVNIIGITTTMPDYKLAWNINTKLNINLVKRKDIVPEGLNGEFAYAYYLYDEGENSNVYNLVSINDKGALWLKLPVTTDYLLIIRNSIHSEKLTDILKTIRKTEQLVHAFLIEQERIKGIDPLLEQIELHEMELMKNINKRLSRK
ncbi:MAG: IPExxxVDY family protein [Bacteroidales bacterium]|jgi:hypothetical protein|nr:IPExxxVDY family protein [Bacteroidales bacterium]